MKANSCSSTSLIWLGTVCFSIAILIDIYEQFFKLKRLSMKSNNKKQETMRKIIVSQAETINQQNKEIKSLTAENQRLKTDYQEMNKVMARCRKIFNDIEHQDNEYAKIKKCVQKSRRKLMTKLEQIR